MKMRSYDNAGWYYSGNVEDLMRRGICKCELCDSSRTEHSQWHNIHSSEVSK